MKTKTFTIFQFPPLWVVESAGTFCTLQKYRKNSGDETIFSVLYYCCQIWRKSADWVVFILPRGRHLHPRIAHFWAAFKNWQANILAKLYPKRKLFSKIHQKRSYPRTRIRCAVFSEESNQHIFDWYKFSYH